MSIFNKYFFILILEFLILKIDILKNSANNQSARASPYFVQSYDFKKKNIKSLT